jgi:putative sterol carrier protein
MNETPTFEFLADELAGKIKNLSNAGLTMRFVFVGMGSLYIDARRSEPTLERDREGDADFTVTAPLEVWLALRAKKLAPHVAAMTGKMKFSGNVIKGLALAPKIMAVI